VRLSNTASSPQFNNFILAGNSLKRVAGFFMAISSKFPYNFLNLKSYNLLIREQFKTSAVFVDKVSHFPSDRHFLNKMGNASTIFK
jgi:hypothetical protein